MDFVYVNNRMVPAKEALIPVTDRGFRFGDGVFETIRVVRGIPYQWEYHLRRLEKGLQALRICFDVSGLLAHCRALLAKNQVDDGFLRIAITRGSGSTGYLPTGSTPTLVIETLPLAPVPEGPVDLWHSTYHKIPASSLPHYAKTMQGLNATLARLEAQENHCFEALMLNGDKHVCEGSSSTIFWVKGGIVFTPALEAGVLPGSIRDAVIRLSPLPVKEALLFLDDVARAEEVFLTNVSWLALPVKSLQPEGYEWSSYGFATQMNRLLREDMERYAVS